MKLAQWVVAGLAVAMFALAGCGGDKKEEGGGKSGGGGGTPTVTVKLDTPRAALETMHKAAMAKDMAGVVACMDPALQAPMKEMLENMARMKDKPESVAKVVEAKIGKEQADKVRGSEMSESDKQSPLNKAMKDGKVDWDKIKIDEQGDKATVKIEGDDPFTMKKIDGKWYACPPESEELTPEKMKEQVAQMKKMMDPMLKALDEVEKKVNDGTITKENFDEEYGKIMLGAMGGMMGGGETPAPAPSPEPKNN